MLDCFIPEGKRVCMCDYGSVSFLDKKPKLQDRQGLEQQPISFSLLPVYANEYAYQV